MFNPSRLKKLRTDLRLSQEEMSERLRIPQSSYSKYETNKADLNLALLQKLKDEFGIAPKEFFSDDNKTIHFESGSNAEVNDVVKPEYFYSFPKEIIDSILISQQNITQLINLVINEKKIENPL